MPDSTDAYWQIRRIPWRWHPPTHRGPVRRACRWGYGWSRLAHAGRCWHARLMGQCVCRVNVMCNGSNLGEGWRRRWLCDPGGRWMQMSDAAEAHVVGSRVPLQAGACRGAGRRKSISGRRSAATRPIAGAAQRLPQIALGLPWSSLVVCRLHARPRRRCWARAGWGHSL